MTVMYCASAEGIVLRPFYVYPAPKSSTYDLLLDAKRGSGIHFSPKGYWIQMFYFSALIDYFDNTVDTNDRPNVFLIDTVSSTINTNIFTKAESRLIEIYRLVPTATNLMHLLEKRFVWASEKRVKQTVH